MASYKGYETHQDRLDQANRAYDTPKGREFFGLDRPLPPSGKPLRSSMVDVEWAAVRALAEQAREAANRILEMAPPHFPHDYDAVDTIAHPHLPEVGIAADDMRRKLWGDK